jgi:hypothetical protein
MLERQDTLVLYYTAEPRDAHRDVARRKAGRQSTRFWKVLALRRERSSATSLREDCGRELRHGEDSQYKEPASQIILPSQVTLAGKSRYFLLLRLS